MHQPMEEAQWPTSFDMDHFKSLTSFKARMDYCNAHLHRIGGGTGRMVYQIDDQTAIKLAKNAKGVAQNEAEDDPQLQNRFDHIVTRVLDRHPDHLWIESELAKKVTPNRFKQLSGGLNIDDIATWMYNYSAGRNGGKKQPQNKEIDDRIWNNEFFVGVADIGDEWNMNYGDFGVLSSYGEVNGELRLVDYGLSEEVYNVHYAPKKNSIYGYRPMARMYEHIVSRVMERILNS